MATSVTPTHEIDDASLRAMAEMESVGDVMRPLHDAIFEIAELASRDEEMDAFYSAIHRIVRTLTSAENFFIALLHEADGYVTFPYYKEKDIAAYPDDRVDLEEVRSSTFTSLVLERRDVVHLGPADFSRVAVEKQIVIEVGEIPKQWLGVPLMKNDQLLGALVVQSFQQDFEYTDEDKRLLVYVGQHVAASLQQKEDRLALLDAHRQLQKQNSKLSRTNDELKRVLAERAAIQKTLRHNATHDPLTGLPNRAKLEEQLESLMSQPESTFGVLFLDLDRFKIVNDSLGHLAGDALLQEVAERLEHAVREDDVVARFGGDEFCVLLNGLEDQATLNNTASRIIETLRRPVQLNDQPVVISTSIGATVGPAEYRSTDEILRDADTALYSAKARGRATYRVFDEQLRKTAVNRMRLEQDLREAICHGQLTLNYQPIVDVQTNRITAVESLVRWDHPELGAVSPSSFIPIAEETGLIRQITECVMTESARSLSEFRLIPGCEQLRAHVNVSGALVEPGELQRKVSKAIIQNSLPAEALRLEITESSFLSHYDAATQILSSLSELGVGLAVDDFGTGYSSLTYIHDLPIDEIKIDLSFVRTVHTNARSHAIVQTILALASVLELSVTAEGVETEHQCRSLSEMGVRKQQGFYFARPCTATELTHLLSHQDSAAWTSRGSQDSLSTR